MTIITLGNSYNNQGRFKDGTKKCMEGLEMAGGAKLMMEQRDGCKCLYNGYKGLGNDKLALKYHELYLNYKDSMDEEGARENLKQMEFEKQVVLDSIAEAKEAELAFAIAEEENAAKAYRRRIQYSAIIIVVLLLGAIIAIGRKKKLKPKLARALIFIFFLLLFEFVLVIMDPYVDMWSEGEVWIKLVVNSLFAVIIFTAHQFFEGRIRKVIANPVEA